MSEQKRIGVLNVSGTTDPATQQAPLSQGRAGKSLHQELRKLAAAGEADGCTFERLDFVGVPKGGDAGQEADRRTDDVGRIEVVGGGEFTALAWGWKHWLDSLARTDRDKVRFDILVAGTLETARLAVKLRQEAIAEKVVYVANHLLRPLRHWGIPVSDENLELEAYCLNEAQAVVFPSESQREHFSTYYPRSPDIRTACIYHGFTDLGSDEGRKKADKGVRPDVKDHVILFMASPLHQQSDYATALYALRRIVAAHSAPVTLRLAGMTPWPESQPGPEAERRHLAAIAADLDLPSNLEFLGHLAPAQMRRCYEEANVTLVTSVVEAFGDIVAESLSVETPVVATATGAIPIVVRGELQGRTVAPRSPWAFAQSALDVINDYEGCSFRPGEDRSRMKETVHEMTWLRTARGYLSLFSDLLSPSYILRSHQLAASNRVRERLRQRLLARRGYSIRKLAKATGKSFELVRRVFDESASPNLRWQTVEPIARHLCDKRELGELRTMLESRSGT